MCETLIDREESTLVDQLGQLLGDVLDRLPELVGVGLASEDAGKAGRPRHLLAVFGPSNNTWGFRVSVHNSYIL